MKEFVKKYRVFIAIVVLIVGIMVVMRLWKIGATLPHVQYSATIAEPPLHSELDIVFGCDKATLPVFMYADYSCRYCKRFFEDVLPSMQQYLNNKSVCLIVKLVGKSTHPSIQRAQRAAVCVHRHGNYKALHELYVFNYLSIYTQEFAEMLDDFIAQDDLVAQCMLEGESEEYLNANNLEFDSKGFSGTPTFVIGTHVYKGFKDEHEFEQIIEHELELLNKSKR